MSKELDILTALETALSGITIANGYQTDAGVNVYKNHEYETAPEASLWPCCLYFPGELQSGYEGDTPPCLGEQNNYMPVLLEGFILDDERGTAGQKLKEDFRKMLTAAGSFGNLVEEITSYKTDLEVKPGSDGYWSYVSASFILYYITPWGGM